jgi:hypothetical protein
MTDLDRHQATCAACGHLTAAHAIYPMPVGFKPEQGARIVCYACRDNGTECSAHPERGPGASTGPP